MDHTFVCHYLNLHADEAYPAFNEREKTLEALSTGRYSSAVLRRAVRKSCEWLRVSSQDKTYLKPLVR